MGPKSLRTTVLKVSLEIEECFSTQLSEQWQSEEVQSEFSHIVLFINNSQTQFCMEKWIVHNTGQSSTNRNANVKKVNTLELRRTDR